MGQGVCIPACHWAGVCVSQDVIGQGGVIRGVTGGVHPPDTPPTLVNKWAVYILLECFLVSQVSVHKGRRVCIHGVVCLGGLHPGGSALGGWADHPRVCIQKGVGHPPPELEKRAVRILLECFLVLHYFYEKCMKMKFLNQPMMLIYTRRLASPLADLRGGAKDARPPWGPNSFIFMQFSGKKLKNNSTFGSWRTPLGKILDPPLVSVSSCRFRSACI